MTFFELRARHDKDKGTAEKWYRMGLSLACGFPGGRVLNDDTETVKHSRVKIAKQDCLLTEIDKECGTSHKSKVLTKT